MSDVSSPICPRCDSSRTARVKRNGFFQTVVLPYIDRYPWECSSCRVVFTFKSRGKLKSRRTATAEAQLPTLGS